MPAVWERAPVLALTDMEAAHAWLGHRYGFRSVSQANVPSRFVFRHTERRLGPMRFVRFEHPLRVRFALERPDVALQVKWLTRGRARLVSGAAQAEMLPGSPVLIDPSRPARGEWDDVGCSMVAFDAAAVDHLVKATYGSDRSVQPRDAVSASANAVTVRRWQQLMRFAFETAFSVEEPGELLIDGLFRTVVHTLVEAFPIVETSSTDGAQLGGTALKKVLDYIEDRAAEPLTLSDMAQLVHTTPRNLQYIFRRELECTPVNYLRRVRLAKAHHQLVHADPLETTVSKVASQWGFSHQGRFAAAYRQRYGMSPRQTLGTAPTQLPVRL